MPNNPGNVSAAPTFNPRSASRTLVPRYVPPFNPRASSRTLVPRYVPPSQEQRQGGRRRRTIKNKRTRKNK